MKGKSSFRGVKAAVAKLAEYIPAADQQGLQGQPFRNGVVQMLALAIKKEATAGLSLPFGPTVVGLSEVAYSCLELIGSA